jgi:hypothetical protein
VGFVSLQRQKTLKVHLSAAFSSTTVRPLIRPKGTEHPQRSGLHPIVVIMNGRGSPEIEYKGSTNPPWNCAPASMTPANFLNTEVITRQDPSRREAAVGLREGEGRQRHNRGVETRSATPVDDRSDVAPSKENRSPNGIPRHCGLLR